MPRPRSTLLVRPFNVCLDERHRELLAALQQETGVPTAAEVLRHALDLYDACRGCEVFVRLPGGGEALTRVVVPGLTCNLQ